MKLITFLLLSTLLVAFFFDPVVCKSKFFLKFFKFLLHRSNFITNKINLVTIATVTKLPPPKTTCTKTVTKTLTKTVSGGGTKTIVILSN
jgi:hypothetical protein